MSGIYGCGEKPIEMPATATAIMQDQADKRLRSAMDRLLYKLRGWVSVYPMMEDDRLPEHDVQWWAGADGKGPQADILAAIRENPALWAHAVPEECCIVPKAMLKQVAGTVLGVLGTADMVEVLAGHGAHIVEAYAARARYEREELERQQR